MIGAMRKNRIPLIQMIVVGLVFLFALGVIVYLMRLLFGGVGFL